MSFHSQKYGEKTHIHRQPKTQEDQQCSTCDIHKVQRDQGSTTCKPMAQADNEHQLKWSNFLGSTTTAQDPCMTQGPMRTAQNPQVTQHSITDKNQWVVTGSVVSGTTNTQHHPGGPLHIFCFDAGITTKPSFVLPTTPIYPTSVCIVYACVCACMYVPVCH